jgi:hypothetical protein
MPRPDLSRVPDYYHKYISQVKEDDLMVALQKQTKKIARFLRKIPSDKRNYRYAEGKWTIKEVLQHIIDAERVFAYRALCFARKDSTPLPSFDENLYADNSKAAGRKWKDLVNEFVAVRVSTLLLFGSFDEEQMEASGTASGKSVYAGGIGFIIAGHANHHLNIIKAKYMKQTIKNEK